MMGQWEVYDLMRELRRKDDKWYTTTEVKKELLLKGYTKNQVNGIAGDLLRLSLFNLIQMRGVGIWEHHNEFRAFKHK